VCKVLELAPGVVELVFLLRGQVPAEKYLNGDVVILWMLLLGRTLTPFRAFDLPEKYQQFFRKFVRHHLFIEASQLPTKPVGHTPGRHLYAIVFGQVVTFAGTIFGAQTVCPCLDAHSA
jgi:hypothetical protein